MPKEILTQEKLKRVLSYCPATGLFKRKERTANSVRIGDTAGCVNKIGYIQVSVNGRLHYGHRLAFLYMEGVFPVGQVDHVSGCRSDNRWANLRAVSNRENQRNAARGKNNTSGVTGVSWDEPRGKWSVRIGRNSKSVAVGRFANFEAAVSARKEAEVRYGYHKNHGRAL